ncbi:Uncharacterised protein [Streptococcus pneumoniae]|nr:Uncharacterised protein [Streptococcus pneumoniae]
MPTEKIIPIIVANTINPQDKRPGLSKKLLNTILFLFVFTYSQSNGNTKNTVICEITSIVFSETFARPNGIIIRNTPIIIHPKKLRSLIRENA